MQISFRLRENRDPHIHMTSTHVLIILLTPSIRKSNKRLIVRGDLFIFWGLKKKCRNNTKCIYEKWNSLHLQKLKYNVFYGGQYYIGLCFQNPNSKDKIQCQVINSTKVYTKICFWFSMIICYLLLEKKQKY